MLAWRGWQRLRGRALYCQIITRPVQLVNITGAEKPNNSVTANVTDWASTWKGQDSAGALAAPPASAAAPAPPRSLQAAARSLGPRSSALGARKQHTVQQKRGWLLPRCVLLVSACGSSTAWLGLKLPGTFSLLYAKSHLCTALPLVTRAARGPAQVPALALMGCRRRCEHGGGEPAFRALLLG